MHRTTHQEPCDKAYRININIRTHARIYIYIYIYITLCVCVCVCVCVCKGKKYTQAFVNKFYQFITIPDWFQP